MKTRFTRSRDVIGSRHGTIVSVTSVLLASLFAVLTFGSTFSPVLAQQKAKEEPATAKETPKPKPNKSESRAAAIRTLDAINIEGEIAVPQVLFITARDYRRFRDGLDLKFRMKPADVARSLELPARLRVVSEKKEEGQ